MAWQARFPGATRELALIWTIHRHTNLIGENYFALEGIPRDRKGVVMASLTDRCDRKWRATLGEARRSRRLTIRQFKAAGIDRTLW